MNKTKVFAVRIGDKYGQDVENYIESKISNVTWIRDELPDVKLQWNKLRVMNMDIDEPVLVIDIDMLFMNDYVKAIDYPIKKGGDNWTSRGHVVPAKDLIDYQLQQLKFHLKNEEAIKDENKTT